jgi:methyltransferase (TIGR00027 family)
VVDAIEGGSTQVVIAGAGYDGRALRYAKPGVRWFEVDHPDTQRDKRQRLEQLAIETPHIAFVPADFTVDPVAERLLAAGHDPTDPTLFLCEGVAVYLDLPVLESVLHNLRQAACPGSRLAISLSTSSESPRRKTFQAAVAAMGEPARSVLTGDDADTVFAATGWRATNPTTPDTSDDHHRARRVGLVTAEPR